MQKYSSQVQFNMCSQSDHNHCNQCQDKKEAGTSSPDAPLRPPPLPHPSHHRVNHYSDF